MRNLFKKIRFKKYAALKNRFANEMGAHSVPKLTCHCLDAQRDSSLRWQELSMHTELQDKSCDGWFRLLELIEKAAKDGRKDFSPGPEMPPEDWAQITELPASIAKLKEVEKLNLYGSSLVRIPPEIGEMESLEEFTPYTSYRLHWFPYEITRCKKLRSSTVSTRAIYGNYKYRPQFPRLPQIDPLFTPAVCSVCKGTFGEHVPMQVWLSLQVATDVLPLLVHACSDHCIADLPTPPENYIPHPHQGGLELKQPVTYIERLRSQERGGAS